MCGFFKNTSGESLVIWWPTFTEKTKGEDNLKPIHRSQETHPIDKDQTENEEIQILFPAAFPFG